MEKLFTINGHTRELLCVVVLAISFFFFAIVIINKAISLIFHLMNFLHSAFKSIII